MKTNGLLRGLSAIVMVGLLASTLVFFVDSRPAAAAPNKENEQTGTTKVLVSNLQPGEMVTAYAGDFDRSFDPAFVKANSATPAALDGKPVEVFVDVNKITTLFVVDRNGTAHWLSQVAPSRSDQPNIILWAAATDQSINKGLASPTTNESGGPAIEKASAAAAGFTHSHQIAPGETLSAIARQYNTTAAALASANSLADPNLIIAGQSLMTPSPASR